MAANRVSLVQVQAWMGHADIQTTARYLHAKRQADTARRASAFTVSDTRVAVEPASSIARSCLIEDDGWQLSRQRGSHRQ